ncbi:MAG: transposase, partial [Verrucomicrobia bacterium]|nr:transposase [Verrucomicrobiota bacterium]
GIAPLVKAAQTFLKHGKGLLNYFLHKIDNGKAEGINNKIKVLKRQAYGFRDIEYFTLKLYNLHKQTHELVG